MVLVMGGMRKYTGQHGGGKDRMGGGGSQELLGPASPLAPSPAGGLE